MSACHCNDVHILLQLSRPTLGISAPMSKDSDSPESCFLSKRHRVWGNVWCSNPTTCSSCSLPVWNLVNRSIKWQTDWRLLLGPGPQHSILVYPYLSKAAGPTDRPRWYTQGVLDWKAGAGAQSQNGIRTSTDEFNSRKKKTVEHPLESATWKTLAQQLKAELRGHGWGQQNGLSPPPLVPAQALEEPAFTRTAWASQCIFSWASGAKSGTLGDAALSRPQAQAKAWGTVFPSPGSGLGAEPLTSQPTEPSSPKWSPRPRHRTKGRHPPSLTLSSPVAWGYFT